MAINIYSVDSAELIELYGDETIELDINVNDIYDISKVFTPISKTFKVPATKANNKLFKHYYNVNLDGTFNAYEKFNIIMEVDSVPLLEGYLQLISVDVVNNEPQSYEILVASEVANFIRDLGESVLVDLPIDAAHEFNLTNITGSWGGSVASGDVRYCMADLAAKTTTTPLIWQASGTPASEEDFLPTISCKRIFDKIFSEVGYTYTSTFLEDTGDNFHNLFLVCEAPGDADNFNDKLFEAVTVASHTATSGLTAVPYSSEIYDIGGNYNNGTYTYTIPFTGDYEFSFNGSVRNFGATNGGFLFSLNVNGVSQFVSPFGFSFIPVGVTLNFGSVFPKFTYTAGDLITLSFNYDPSGETDIRLTSGASFSCISGPITPVGTTIQPQSLFPEIKQRDFIAGIGKIFNLVFLPNPDKPKDIIIEPRSTWINDGQVRDWRTNLMQDKPLTISPTTEVQKRAIKFNFEQGDDYVSEQYFKVYGYPHGSQQLQNTGNEFASDELVVEAPFIATLVNGVAGDLNLQIPNIYKEDGKEAEIGMRLLYWNGTRSCAGVYLRDSQANTTALYINVPAMMVYNDDDLATDTFSCTFAPPEVPFGDVPTKNAFTEYWAQYIGELYSDDARILKCSVKVNPTAIYQLKLNDTIYLLDDYWRINTLTYDIQQEVAQVVLYRADFYTNNICTADSVQVNSDGTVSFFSQGSAQAATERCCDFYRYTWNRTDGKCYWRTRNNASIKRNLRNALQSWGSLSGSINDQRDLGELTIDGGGSGE